MGSFFAKFQESRAIALGTAVILGLACSAQAAEKVPFEPFWAKFKAAVAAKSSAQVAAISKFPLTMPYGADPVADAKALETRFAEVFDSEADANACFSADVPEPRDGGYEIACGMKDGDDEAGKPNVYSFELVDGAWKFIGFDNVNE